MSAALTNPTSPSCARSLLVGFALVIGLLLAMAGIGTAYLGTLDKSITRIVDVHNERSRLASEMLIAARERSLYLHAILLERDAFARDAMRPGFDEIGGAFRRARAKLMTLDLTPRERRILEAQASITARVALLQEQVLDLALAERDDEAVRLLISQAMPEQKRVAAQLHAFLDAQIATGHTAARVARHESRLARSLMLLSALAASLISGVIAWRVIQRQTRLIDSLNAENTARRTLEASLQDMNADLQRRVDERTAALLLANQRMEADIDERNRAQALLKRQYEELEKLNRELKETQVQLLHADKMASIGQLAAGVAHEINNPIGFVQSNLGSLEYYINDLLRMLAAYEDCEASLPENSEKSAELGALRARLDLPFIKDDIPELIRESREGITRVRKIVQNLKDFSRQDSASDWQLADLREGLDSTLNIVNNEIKYRADVVREYGDMPKIECLPSQLNQVFMNLLVNAAHAIEGPRGTITVRTGATGDEVWVEVEDTGHGIPEDVRGRIFDPFFTTKAVGKGTGLGLSLAYGIVKKHAGRIDVMSEPGKGTVFRVTLPVKHTDNEEVRHDA